MYSQKEEKTFTLDSWKVGMIQIESIGDFLSVEGEHLALEDIANMLNLQSIDPVTTSFDQM